MSDDNGPRTPPRGGLPQAQLKLQLDEDVAQGMYSNLPLVAASETEFVLDFIYVQPQEPKGKVRARVLLSPKAAKLLSMRLKHRVEQYEERFGEIPMPSVVFAPPDGETVN